ncbi:TolB family protein [Acidobacteriota bacterium]
MKKSAIFAVLFVALAGMVFAKFHPGIKWREISDEQFIVIFPQGYEAEASYTLEIARDIYEKLHKLWGNRVRKKIRIVLIDSYDYANGSATFFPFNWIEIYLYAPVSDSAIGGCRDWIHMVLSHEMNHVFNMNAGSGFTYFMRRLAGSNPVFFPMIYAPVWLAEGWAVYAESRFGSGGRLDTPDFEIMLKQIGAVGKVPDSARIYGEPTPWPGPVSSYLYGAKFVAFLARKYGEHKVRELAYNFGYHFVLLLMSSRFKAVFGKSLNRLWGEFIDGIAFEKGYDKSRVDILTTGDLIKKYSLFGPGNKIFYAAQNYKKFPGIYEMDLSTGKNRRLLKKTGINSLYYDKNHRKIYFSAVRYYKVFYRYSDLYEFDIDRNKLKRLSSGRRLSYPVRRGNKIYCVKRVKTKSFLAVLAAIGGKEKIISKGYDSLAQISISPDYKHIAATLKEKNRSWRIALFTLSGELLYFLPIPCESVLKKQTFSSILSGTELPVSSWVAGVIRFLTNGDVKSYAPLWKDDETICFITEDGSHYRLASIRLTTGKFFICSDDSVPDLKYFSIHPEGEQVIVSFFDANGFNLGLLRNPLLSDLHGDVPAGQGESDLENLCFFDKVSQREPTDFNMARRNGSSQKYNFFRELLSKYFSINYRDAGRDIQPGIYLSGNDVL